MCLFVYGIQYCIGSECGLVLNISGLFFYLFNWAGWIFFTYLTKPDGLSVAKYFYCDELSIAKTSNKLSVAKAGVMDSLSLKMKSVAVYIQQRLQ
jgi:hypothetical protein